MIIQGCTCKPTESCKYCLPYEAEKLDHARTELLLDEIAEWFDTDSSVHPSTLIVDVNGQAITMQQMLGRIRLHKAFTLSEND